MRQRIARIPGRVLRNRPVRDYALITAGVLIAAAGMDAFLIPNKIAAGGVSGLATVVYHLALERGVTVPVGAQMLAMNLVLLVIGIKSRGWRYGARTVYGTVALSVAIDAMAPFIPNAAPDSELLAVLYGGALGGLGLGLVFKAGGNTGGTDIIAQLLTPKLPLGVGQIMLAVDGVVIAIAGVAFGPELALWAFLAVFVSARVIDVVQEGLAVVKAAFIITDKPEEITHAILFELDRGATGLQGRGLYSGTEREVIFCVVARNELDRLKAIVRTVDPKAFLIVTDVHEAVGEGFKEIGAHYG
ncbi:MAG: YitT family protein [Coriobacteriia bacterium]